MKNKPDIQIWLIEKLKEWENNPRNLTEKGFDRLKKQIYELDIYKPLLINKDGTVLGGNMRLKAFREYGLKEVTVSIVDASTEEMKLKYALSDNDQVGYTDKEKILELIEQYPDIQLSDYAIHLDEPETLDKFMEQFKEVIEDEVPETPSVAISKLGEVYQLGRHRLMCGDATKIEDVEKLMDGKKADMVFTDPPYGMGKDIENDDMKGSKFDQWNRDWVSILPINKRASFVAYHSTKTFPTLLNAGIECGWDFDRVLMFYRPDKFPTHNWNGWVLCSQVIMLFSKQKGIYSKNGLSQQDVITVTSSTMRNSDTTGHPTEKPIKHIVTILDHFEDGILLDLFGGSGSTLIACEQTNRICYMCELDEKYVDVIRKRYAKFIGKEEQWQTITPKI